MDMQRNTENANNEQFECCIMCGVLTCIPVDMQVDWRENYEVGCGQLCAECAEGRKKAADKEKLEATAKILRGLK